MLFTKIFVCWDVQLLSDIYEHVFLSFINSYMNLPAPLALMLLSLLSNPHMENDYVCESIHIFKNIQTASSSF